jgi:hypothetical protein
MKATISRILILLVVLVLIPAGLVFAQDEIETLTIKLRRDFGFGMGGRIQGSLTLSAQGPSDLDSVDFLIDDLVVFRDDEPPFEFKFHTSEFDVGVHALAASGTTQRGTIVNSEVLRFEFVTAEQGWDAAGDIIIPMFILIVVISVIGVSATSLVSRKKGFQIGEYGAAGGAVCSRCSLPFSRSVLSPNLVLGKLERCPHCNKWGIVRRAASEELADAERRYQADSHEGRMAPRDEESRWERLIDESRFENE